MNYLSIGCFLFFVTGIQVVNSEIINKRYEIKWQFESAPVLFLFIWIVSIALGFAIFLLTVWTTYLIGTNQTSVEFQINSELKEITKKTGEVFRNDFDMGCKRNFRDFFGISETRSWWTILLPYPYSALGDGTLFTTLDNIRIE